MRNDRKNRDGRKLRIYISHEDDGTKIEFPPELSWEPPADVIVTQDDVIVVFDISGMDSDSINIVTDGDRLRIGGVRGSVCCEGRRQYHQIEIRVGRFFREIELPVPVDHLKTAARYERGMLEVRIARQDPSSRVRRVEIE